MSPSCCVEKPSHKLPSCQTTEGANDDDDDDDDNDNDNDNDNDDYDDDDDDDDDQNNMESIERIILSKWFWAYTQMMGGFANTVLGLFSWCEGCPCHRQKDIKLQQRCAMKGRLAAHFAAGEMCTCLASLASQQQLPHCLCGLAHVERSVSIASGARALTLFDALKEGDPGKDHPIVVKFCVTSRDDLQAYMAGRTLKELPELLQAIAAFRFLPTAERNIEGQHSIVHRKIAGKPNVGLWLGNRQNVISWIGFNPEQLFGFSNARRTYETHKDERCSPQRGERIAADVAQG
eukprot:4501330-Amphidinium_carterae.3